MSPSRRRFLFASSATLLPCPAFARTRNANAKVNLAVIGVANRGKANLDGVASENIVALCDVDPAHAAAARKRFPDAAYFTDYRKLFDNVANKIDAVVVSTPDHSHALPTVIAASLGKHVYCEKPLCHTVDEVRVVRKAVAAKKLVTQMGTQIHAGDNYRRAVEIVKGGGLGPVNRVRVWLNGKPPAGKRTGPTATADFDLDLWQGPSPVAPFAAQHAGGQRWPHYNWRYWWAFGGGNLADFGCHFMDLPFWALGLTAPTTVKATGKVTHGGDNDVPDVMQVDYQFPAVGDRPAVHLTWYHGVGGPAVDGSKAFKGFPSGVLFEGEKGQLVADYSKLLVLPDEFGRTFRRPAESIPKSPGHHAEWLEAVRGGGSTTCHFDYSGGLTEAVLLGNVAYRAGGAITWDAAAGRVTDNPKAAAFLGKEYRKGWELP